MGMRMIATKVSLRFHSALMSLRLPTWEKRHHTNPHTHTVTQGLAQVPLRADVVEAADLAEKTPHTYRHTRTHTHDTQLIKVLLRFHPAPKSRRRREKR